MTSISSTPVYKYSLGNAYDQIVASEFRKQRNHRDTAYVSWYMREGSVRILSDAPPLHAQTGDWVFIDALTTRSHDFSANAKLVSIRHRANWRGLQFIPPPRPPSIYRGKLNDNLLDAAEALIAFTNDHANHTQSEKGSLISLGTARLHTWLYFWHQIRETANDSRPRLNDPRAYTIMAQIAEQKSIRPIPYKRIANKLGLSKSQIDRIFKAELGITPKQWQEAQCLRSAEDLLASGAYTSNEIAAKLDFFDASHFCKWFSQQSGLAPGKWKQQHKDGA